VVTNAAEVTSEAGRPSEAARGCKDTCVEHSHRGSPAPLPPADRSGDATTTSRSGRSATSYGFRRIDPVREAVRGPASSSSAPRSPTTSRTR
jgi:hypothetical protein